MLIVTCALALIMALALILDDDTLLDVGQLLRLLASYDPEALL